MPGSPYMPEMTNLQVREYLEGGGRTVIVPVGSTEDHGDHGPLWTDVYIPTEVARRAARRAGRARRAARAVRAGRRPPRRARACLSAPLDVHRAAPRRRRDARRGGLPPHRAAERPLREHVGDAVRGRRLRHELPEGTRVYPFAYWLGLRLTAPRATSGRTWYPRERGGDIRDPRDRPGALRHGAGARLHARVRRAAHEPVHRARRGDVRPARRVPRRDGRRRRRVGQPDRIHRGGRARSSSTGAPRPSSTSSRDLEAVHDQLDAIP